MTELVSCDGTESSKDEVLRPSHRKVSQIRQRPGNEIEEEIYSPLDGEERFLEDPSGEDDLVRRRLVVRVDFLRVHVEF